MGEVKKGQIAVENLILVGIIIAILVPSVVFYYRSVQTREVDAAKIVNTGNAIVTKIAALSKGGENEWMTVQFDFPEESGYITAGNLNEIMIVTPRGETAFFLPKGMILEAGDIPLKKGRNTVKISSKGAITCISSPTNSCAFDSCKDLDFDGATTCTNDCNDGNANILPGAPEVCNRVDDDCDGLIDEGWDGDGDGFVNGNPLSPECLAGGWTELTADCDDLDITVYPGAPELCDGKDNDCNPATPIDVDIQPLPGCPGSAGWCLGGMRTECSFDEEEGIPMLQCDRQPGDNPENTYAKCKNGIDDDCDSTTDNSDEDCARMTFFADFDKSQSDPTTRAWLNADSALGYQYPMSSDLMYPGPGVNDTGLNASRRSISPTQPAVLAYSATGNFNAPRGSLAFWAKSYSTDGRNIWRDNDFVHTFFMVKPDNIMLSPPNKYFFYVMKDGGNRLTVGWWTQEAASPMEQRAVFNITSTWLMDTWHFFVVTWDNTNAGTKKLNAYVDGQRVIADYSIANKWFSIDNSNYPGKFYVGNYVDSIACPECYKDFANASIDDLAVYSDVLTPDNISLMYMDRSCNETVVELTCFDGLDNDCDGRIDDKDEDCQYLLFYNSFDVPKEDGSYWTWADISKGRANPIDFALMTPGPGVNRTGLNASGYKQAGVSPRLVYDKTNNFYAPHGSIAFWVKSAADDGTNIFTDYAIHYFFDLEAKQYEYGFPPRFLLSKENISFSNMMSLQVLSIDNNPTLFRIMNTSDWNRDRWKFVVITWDGTSYNAYINGSLTHNVLVGSQWRDWTGEGNMSIGAKPAQTNPPNFHANASIDNFAIYSYALNASAVMQLYRMSCNETEETTCNDGLDNDCDNAVDMEDASCSNPTSALVPFTAGFDQGSFNADSSPASVMPIQNFFTSLQAGFCSEKSVFVNALGVLTYEAVSAANGRRVLSSQKGTIQFWAKSNSFTGANMWTDNQRHVLFYAADVSSSDFLNFLSVETEGNRLKVKFGRTGDIPDMETLEIANIFDDRESGSLVDKDIIMKKEKWYLFTVAYELTGGQKWLNVSIADVYKEGGYGRFESRNNMDARMSKWPTSFNGRLSFGARFIPTSNNGFDQAEALLDNITILNYPKTAAEIQADYDSYKACTSLLFKAGYDLPESDYPTSWYNADISQCGVVPNPGGEPRNIQQFTGRTGFGIVNVKYPASNPTNHLYYCTGEEGNENIFEKKGTVEFYVKSSVDTQAGLWTKKIFSPPLPLYQGVGLFGIGKSDYYWWLTKEYDSAATTHSVKVHYKYGEMNEGEFTIKSWLDSSPTPPFVNTKWYFVALTWSCSPDDILGQCNIMTYIHPIPSDPVSYSYQVIYSYSTEDPAVAVPWPDGSSLHNAKMYLGQWMRAPPTVGPGMFAPAIFDNVTTFDYAKNPAEIAEDSGIVPCPWQNLCDRTLGDYTNNDCIDGGDILYTQQVVDGTLTPSLTTYDCIDMNHDCAITTADVTLLTQVWNDEGQFCSGCLQAVGDCHPSVPYYCNSQGLYVQNCAVCGCVGAGACHANGQCYSTGNSPIILKTPTQEPATPVPPDDPCPGGDC